MADDDLWQQIQNLTDIVKAPDVPMCSGCLIEMKIGNGFISCPKCKQVVDSDYSVIPVLVDRTVVVSNDGAIRSYEKSVYDKKKCIIALYETYLKRSCRLTFPAAVIVTATEILLEVQDVSTANRGRNLTEIMAGCLYAATLEHSYSITETTIARIFNTRSGLSRGKNAVIGLLVKRHAMKGGSPHAYLKKDSKVLCSQFIRESLVVVGLNPRDRNLYMFIKCLCFIEECYGYIDTQIFNAKVVGSIVFYFLNRLVDSAALESGGSTVTPSAPSVVKMLGISYETMKKIYHKLELADSGRTIHRMAVVLKIPLRQKLITL
jgi:hypothetical protein